MYNITESLKVLADYRRHGIRSSWEVVKRGEDIFQRDQSSAFGDDYWAFLEQLAVAAFDCGRIALASVGVDRLAKRFPNSERTVVLQGMLLECTGKPEKAKEFYEAALLKEETSVPIRERLIALHLNYYPLPSSSSQSSSPFSLQQAIDILQDHATTIYLSPEVHAQLASVYESLGLYAESRTSLQNIILISPNDALVVLRIAETDYTMGDWKAAYVGAVRAVEIFNSFSEPIGASRRAGLLAILAAEKLKNEAYLPSSKLTKSPTENKKSSKKNEPASSVGSWSPQYMDEVVELALKRLLEVYTKGWETKGDRIAGHLEADGMQALLTSATTASNKDIVR